MPPLFGTSILFQQIRVWHLTRDLVNVNEVLRKIGRIGEIINYDRQVLCIRYLTRIQA